MTNVVQLKQQAPSSGDKLTLASLFHYAAEEDPAWSERERQFEVEETFQDVDEFVETSGQDDHQAKQSETTTLELNAQIRNGLPDNFRLYPANGTWYAKPSTKPEPEVQITKGPVWVEGIGRDAAGSEWGYLIAWLDRDGRRHQQTVPFKRLGERDSSFIQELMGQGLEISPGPSEQIAFKKLIQGFKTTNKYRSASRIGWHADGENFAFIMPNQIISSNDDDATEKWIFQPETNSSTYRTLQTKGSLVDWVENVFKPASESPFLLSAICLAFTGPLLKFANTGSFGLHFFGASSTGKTISLQCGASVWGNGSDPSMSISSESKSFTQRWLGTANSFEHSCVEANNLLLCLDELHSCPVRDLQSVVFNVVGGKSKGRMAANSSRRADREWLLCFLSSGEVSFAQKIQEDGAKPHAGSAVRMLDIPTNSQIITGSNTAEKAKTLKQNCGKHYGTAGPEFLRRLIKDRTAEEIKNELAVRLSEVQMPTANATEKQRALEHLALLKVAGILAAELLKLPVSEQTINDAVDAIAHAWLGNPDVLSDADRGVQAVRDYISQFRESRFKVLNPTSQTPDAVLGRVISDISGYRDWKNDLFYFTSDGFQRACNGYDITTVASRLRALKLLDSNSGSLQKQVRIENRRERLYSVSAAILEDFNGNEPIIETEVVNESALRAFSGMDNSALCQQN